MGDEKITGPVDDPSQKEPTPIEDGPFRKMATKVEVDPFHDRVTKVGDVPAERAPEPARPTDDGPGGESGLEVLDQVTTDKPPSPWADAGSVEDENTWTPPARASGGTLLGAALVLALAVILCQSIILYRVLSTWEPMADVDLGRNEAGGFDQAPHAAPSADANTSAAGTAPFFPEVDLADDEEPAGEAGPGGKAARLPGARVAKKIVKASKAVEKNGRGPAAGAKVAADAPATLEVVVKPEGDVLIDGDHYGRHTDEQFSLAAGRHRIRVANEDLEISRDYQVRIKKGEHRVLHVDLGQLTSGQACERQAGRFGFVTVGVEGGWAFVYIDGQKVQATPLLNYRIAAGQHRVVLMDEGKRARRVWDICVQGGERTQLLNR